MQKQAHRDWQNWAVVGIRAILILTVGLIVLLQQSLTPALENTTELIVAAAITGGATLALIVLYFIKAARGYVPYAILLTDLIVVGALVWPLQGDKTLLPVVAGVMMISGLLRLGWTLGTVQSVGALLVTVAILVIQQPYFFDFINDYVPSALFMVAFVGPVALWVYLRDREWRMYENRIKEVREDYERKISEMRDSQHAITELSARISATLMYDRVIDAAMDIGRVFINDQSRLVSVVLLFRSGTDMLYVANSRGLNRLDETREIAGKRGVVGRSLIDCQPVIVNDALKDEELKDWVSFGGLQSVLSIPMRIGFDNYGVLLFGSEQADAFNSDRLDTLMALSTQVTIGLQNAVLYTNSVEDKERIIEMEENARKALVRDLHDIPTQTISAVTMRVRIAMRLYEKNRMEEMISELTNVEEMAQRATEEIRHVLFKLRPLALESQGISAALEQLADKTQKTYKQKVMLRLAPDIESYIDQQKQGTLFYLIEEAISNARKYAQADTITVRIGRKNGMLIAQIQDNGIGFEANAVNANYSERGSFGMVNMRERAELLGGTLALESEPGKGTMITVYIPISEEMAGSTSTRAKVNGIAPKSKLAISAQQNVARGVRR